MSATPRSQKGRPIASPSRGTVSFRTRYRSQPSKKRSFVSSSVRNRCRIQRRMIVSYAGRVRRNRTQRSEWPSGNTRCHRVVPGIACMGRKLCQVLSVRSVRVGSRRHRQVVSCDSRFSRFFFVHDWSVGVAARGTGLPPMSCSYSLRVATAEWAEG